MAPDAQVAGIGLVAEAEADANTQVGGLALIAETEVDAKAQVGGLALVTEAEVDSEARIGGIALISEAEVDATVHVAGVALIIETDRPTEEIADTVWDGSNLPNPEGWTDGMNFTGKATVTADKLMHFDVNNRYRMINVRWRSISRTDAETIRTLATTLKDASITLASVLTAIVFPIVDTFRFSPVGGTSSAYDVDIGLWAMTDTR